jgi:hypothetical protein
MKQFKQVNWIMFKLALILSITIFIFSGFKWFAFGMIPLIMLMSLLVTLLFWQRDENNGGV